MITEVASSDAMMDFGARIGALCSGGEVIELVGDIGAGKTTFTKGLAKALGADDEVQSPTFTLSRVYDTTSGVRLAHYDFYRLSDPGVMAIELAEVLSDPHTTTVVEWADAVANVLPADTLRVAIQTTDENTRTVTLHGTVGRAHAIAEALL
ncbi:MAG: tRNA (adenosine(37)-N6)-threonylcarbamoyltransferase complex ATPase subunit type 1 TsaE [Candidatus Saccharimonas sp.]